MPIRINCPAAWRSGSALARALVNDPRMLILDEPLGKLDSLTRITMQAEIVVALAAQAGSPRCW